MWSKDPKRVEHFKKIQGLVSKFITTAIEELTVQYYGGAALEKSVGDYLSAEGVNLFQVCLTLFTP